MTYRPGTIKRDLVVDLPRPRDSASPAFNDLKRDLAELVMAEQQRSSDAERHSATLD